VFVGPQIASKAGLSGEKHLRKNTKSAPRVKRISYLAACPVYTFAFWEASTTCPTFLEDAVADARGSEAVAVVAEFCIQAGQLWTLFLEASICRMKPGFVD
jgi:hypothetical protein